jgi:hypothetical protein
MTVPKGILITLVLALFTLGTARWLENVDELEVEKRGGLPPMSPVCDRNILLTLTSRFRLRFAYCVGLGNV